MMNPARLTQTMTLGIGTSMTALGGGPTPFQSVFAAAVSQAVITHVKSGTALPGIPFAPWPGVPGVGLTVDPASMATLAETFYSANYNEPGIAGPGFILAVMTAISTELALASILSISGFGGLPGKLAGLDENKLAGLILAGLPTEAQTAQGAMQLTKSIAHGVVTAIETEGTLGILLGIPTVPPLIGPPIAIVE